ncbi:hypothetical protein G3O08_03775 [Cryomorpha ignava]|uniref:Uncharacterized protein n=1 Tax=Cryomorpha ignava TaxID=101383 RepID=A0A7K3WLU7_9FLAO|nr:hypothetical protein [Cryomorpha ignava]NEN22623.1 hypothetical protein [Cryomorpha ignava]
MEKFTVITPGQGIGKLHFGLKKDQVEKLLGEPDEIEPAEDQDHLEYWHYDTLGMSLVFDAIEKMRLTTIVSANDETVLYGEKIIDMSRDRLIELLRKKGHKNLTFTEDFDDGSRLETVESDEIEMLIWLREGHVTEVQFGPFFIDEDTVNWP